MSFKTLQDHLGQTLTFSYPPARIVSLCPSQTETLFYLGLKKSIVGITDYCVHPKAEVKNIPRVGGTKNFKLEKIRELKPDLIIAEKEENSKKLTEVLTNEFPVFVTDIKDIPSAYRMILDLGELTVTESKALQLKNEIEQSFATLPLPIGNNNKAAYFIWKNPYQVAGQDTYIHALLKRCGLNNVFETYRGRYPTITPKDLQKEKPDLILLSSEPYPFSEKHIPEFQSILPTSQIKRVDGEIFSWYGSRMLKVPQYIRQFFP